MFCYRFANCRFNLSEYYVAEHEKDYICSQSHESGMSKCDDLPAYKYRGQRCNLSASDVQVPWNGMDTSTPPDAACVNWNQYYTSCRADAKNPFQGAISFDNIGLAWVAIFQVRKNDIVVFPVIVTIWPNKLSLICFLVIPTVLEQVRCSS